MAELSEQQRLEAIRFLTSDLRVYSAHCLKVKAKDKKIVPFVWNRAQVFLHAALERQKAETGKVRALVLKGRQQGACLEPSTKILTADLRWIEIGSAEVGQQLVAVDEETSSTGLGGGKGRKLNTSVIEAVVRTRKTSYRITLSDGRSVVCSGQHRWLVRQSQTQWAWRSIEGMGKGGIKVGDKLRTITDVWGDADLGDAWFGGVIDGEGSLDVGSTGVGLAVSQRANRVLDRMESHCVARGYGHYIVSDDGPRKTKFGRDAVHAVTISSISTMFRLMGLSRPERFIGRQWWVGKSMPSKGEREIVSIEPVGEIDVVDIQTSTGTFIAEGIVSHNSTYIGARFYWQTATQPGTGAFIVAHEDKATSNLFDMVKRYHDNNALAPSIKASNAKELVFGALDSGYKLATAGSKDVGRSNTAQLLHGSEFGFWANAQSHMAGLGNTVPDLPGTEIILESTANGLGNAFHLMWQDAEAGKGDYIAIFIPWFWQDEYRAPVRDDLELTDDDREYQRAYGLDLAQMQWRANKIISYGDGFAWLFDQEYPATASLAFRTSTMNPLVSPSKVQLAVTSKFRDDLAPLLIGCDPAGDGEGTVDRTAIVFRRGRMVFRVEYHERLTTMQIAGKLAGYYAEERPDGLFVDKGGLGLGIVHRLQELNVPVIGVNSAEKATEPDMYENKKAEMWWRMRDWFADEPVRIPNNAALISDICAPQPEVSSNGRRLVEKKEHLAKRQIRSPDGGDALALTFAEPVVARVGGSTSTNSRQAPTAAGY